MRAPRLPVAPTFALHACSEIDSKSRSQPIVTVRDMPFTVNEAAQFDKKTWKMMEKQFKRQEKVAHEHEHKKLVAETTDGTHARLSMAVVITNIPCSSSYQGTTITTSTCRLRTLWCPTSSRSCFLFTRYRACLCPLPCE